MPKLSSQEPRLVVGHNVSYDRARVAEEYRLAKNGTRFLDTMALHIAASGMTSGQRMMKQKQNQQADENLDEVIRYDCMKSRTAAIVFLLLDLMSGPSGCRRRRSTT